jgi:hypothetical protein
MLGCINRYQTRLSEDKHTSTHHTLWTFKRFRLNGEENLIGCRQLHEHSCNWNSRRKKTTKLRSTWNGSKSFFFCRSMKIHPLEWSRQHETYTTMNKFFDKFSLLLQCSVYVCRPFHKGSSFCEFSLPFRNKLVL